MPVQQQMSSFAKRLGSRVAQANAEHKDKPIDTGNRRLPAGIRAGVARLSAMYTKEQTEENGKTPKGETFFRASAIVMGNVENGRLSEQLNGEKIAGMVTQVLIPLCDVPAKGKRKAVSFSENWYEFQNVFKLLSNGTIVCSETPASDPTGQRTEAFYMAAMKALTDPVRMKTNPVYVSFTTRGWTPQQEPGGPKPEEMVFEEWHGTVPQDQIAKLLGGNGQPDPAAGVGAYNGPPTIAADGMPPGPPPTPATPPATATPVAPPSWGNGPVQQTMDTPPTPQQPEDKADLVAALIEAAMADPNGETEDGASAARQLEELAWANGWSKEQTKNADSWAHVGDMALCTPQQDAAAGGGVAPTTSASVPGGVPSVGSKWKFCKRTKDGNKLKNNKGEEFPPQEVEVVSVQEDLKLCTLKTTKDGKDVVDIRTKQPVAVKFEWLEPL